jgi:type IV secretion system protein VirB9
MRAASLMLSLLAATSMASCASAKRPAPQAAVVAPAAIPATAAPAAPIVIASTPVPNPPEPARRSSAARPASEPSDPLARVARANAAARVQPSEATYTNASQIYAYAEGALYQVYAAPGQVTDIILQEGETLSGTGPVAAGDTVRWVIGDTESGSGASRRVHILVKPTRADLKTNLVINTSRRTYHVELRATSATYMASVAWRYPEDEERAAAAEAYAAPVVAIENLNFGYRITGHKPAWRPLRVFDDGRQTVIEFPASVAQSELPPLFVANGDGRATDLVNYRVQGQRIIVDRLFQKAELRLGDRRGQQRVRIERNGAR